LVFLASMREQGRYHGVLHASHYGADRLRSSGAYSYRSAVTGLARDTIMA